MKFRRKHVGCAWTVFRVLPHGFLPFFLQLEYGLDESPEFGQSRIMGATKICPEKEIIIQFTMGQKSVL